MTVTKTILVTDNNVNNNDNIVGHIMFRVFYFSSKIILNMNYDVRNIQPTKYLHLFIVLDTIRLVKTESYCFSIKDHNTFTNYQT